MDRRVLGFALLLSGLTGIVCGAVPALAASRPIMGPALRTSSGGSEPGRRFDIKKVFVVAEVALSLLLLIAAGLFVRSLRSAHAIDPGIDVDRLVSAPLSINLLRYTSAQGRAFYQQVLERTERLPGVESASVARVAMLGGSGRVLSVHVEGRASSHDRVLSEGGGAAAVGDATVINANVVGPRFFETVGIRLLHGRDFDSRDTEQAPAGARHQRRRGPPAFPRCAARSASASAWTGPTDRGARWSASSATASTARSARTPSRSRTCRWPRTTRQA